MLKPLCSLLSSAVAVIAFLAVSGCLGPFPDDQQVITSANIDVPVSTRTVNTIILDGQSNALRFGLAAAIRSELTERTGVTSHPIQGTSSRPNSGETAPKNKTLP